MVPLVNVRLSSDQCAMTHWLNSLCEKNKCEKGWWVQLMSTSARNASCIYWQEIRKDEISRKKQRDILARESILPRAAELDEDLIVRDWFICRCQITDCIFFSNGPAFVFLYHRTTDPSPLQCRRHIFRSQSVFVLWLR